MAQQLKQTDDTRSPASRAMDRAIDAAIAGDPIYPDGAAFINGDDPAAGSAIRRALDEGRHVVLAYADGTTRLLRGEAISHPI
jgi:hypothetical protein